VALRQSFSSSTLSEQDFYMCRTADQLLERGCSSGWGLREGMLAFAQLQRDKQLPVVESCRSYEPLSDSPCSRACTTTLPQLLEGQYRVKPLGSIVEMQRHIRQHGSIVCRMQLYSDIKPFFATYRGGVYKGPGGCPGHQQGRARQGRVCCNGVPRYFMCAQHVGVRVSTGMPAVGPPAAGNIPQTCLHAKTSKSSVAAAGCCCRSRCSHGGRPRGAGGGV
jgi:hypothetical protein